jgi:hypothetical protein
MYGTLKLVEESGDIEVFLRHHVLGQDLEGFVRYRTRARIGDEIHELFSNLVRGAESYAVSDLAQLRVPQQESGLLWCKRL